MQIETTRFGRIDVDPDATITFTQPIIGFPALRRFVLLAGPGDGTVKWLQATENGDTAFLLMDPKLVLPSYALDLRAAELAELGVASETELDVYTLLVVPADQTQVRTNLKAPILINAKQRLGKQTVLDRKDYPIQYFIAQAQSQTESREQAGEPADKQPLPRAGEVAHARTDA